MDDWSANAPGQEKPLIIFDGECTLCLYFVAKGRRITGEEVVYEPFQSLPANGAYGVPRASFEAAVHWIEGGTIYSGARALLEVVKFAGRGGRFFRWLVLTIPGGLPLGEWIYRKVAAHRGAIARLLFREPCSREKSG